MSTLTSWSLRIIQPLLSSGSKVPWVAAVNRGLTYRPTSSSTTSTTIITNEEKKLKSEKWAKAQTIKKLHKTNKAIFGTLVETRPDKLKRLKKEENENHQNRLAILTDDDDLHTFDKSLEESETSKEVVWPPKFVPKGEKKAFEAGKTEGEPQKLPVRYEAWDKGSEINWVKSKSKTIKLPVNVNTNNKVAKSVEDVPPIITIPFPFQKVNFLGATENESSSPSPIVTHSRLPSVSKILNVTMPEEQAAFLKKWEAKMIAEMGEEGFRVYKEGMLTNGKTLHSCIETYLKGTPIDEVSIADSIAGHWKSLQRVLPEIRGVSVLESYVTHPKLMYCGIVDCVASYRNRLVAIDWKTSQKIKRSVAMTYDTPLQIAAYIGALNYDNNYPLKVEEGLIVIAYEDGTESQTFLLTQNDISHYWTLWVQRLKLFKDLESTKVAVQ